MVCVRRDIVDHSPRSCELVRRLVVGVDHVLAEVTTDQYYQKSETNHGVEIGSGEAKNFLHLADLLVPSPAAAGPACSPYGAK